MAARKSIPILLLTGFLGSGKTTLLTRWLRDPVFAGAMVIVNEMGEVGIDDRLVQASAETPLLLENGCVCCEAGEDLAATLERLFWDRLHRTIAPFGWVLIETTGLADPGPIAAMLADNPLLRERYHLAGTVATFDAKTGPARLAEFSECRRQLADASIVILTKTDATDSTEQSAAVARIEHHAPGTVVLKSAAASVTAPDLLGALGAFAPGIRHGHAHHTAGVATAFVDIPAAMDRVAVTAALQDAAIQFGASLLRLKGILALHDSPALHSVQLDPGGGVVMDAVAALGTPVRLGLTIIARGADPTDIATGLERRLKA